MWAETYPRDLGVDLHRSWAEIRVRTGGRREWKREKEREMTGGKEAPNERGGTGKKKRCWFFIAKRERAERKREREWGRKFCSTLSESQRNTLTAVKQSIRRQRVRETEWERERKRERERGRAKNKKGYWTSWSACSTNSWMPAERGLHSWLMSLLSYEIQAYSKQAREVLPTRLPVV